MEKAFMRKFLHSMMLIALLCVPGVTMSQQSFNFSCDFESDADTAAWDYVHDATPNKWFIGSASSNGGSRGLYISNDNGVGNRYSEGNTCVFAYRTLNLPMGNYEFSFDWSAYGESDYDYLRAALVPGSVDLSQVSSSSITSESLPQGWIPLDGGFQLCDLFYGWETESGMVDVPQAGEYKLVFCWQSDAYSAYNPPATVDNIILSLPTCPAPGTPIANNITSNSATLKWSGSATSWYYTYATVANPTTIVASGTVYEDSVVVSDLLANTEYTFSVRSVCGVDSSRAVSTTFRTACSNITAPYFESFENAESYETPLCWTILNGSVQVQPNSSYYPHTTDGNKYLTLKQGATFASSYIENPCNTLELSFLLERQDDEAGNLEIRFTPTLDQANNATLIQTITLTDDELRSYDVDFSASGITTGGYIVFKQVDHYSSYSSLYFDAVDIHDLPTCRRPAKVTISDITYEGATVSWTPVEGAYAYQVVYGLVNDPESSANITLSDLNDPTVTLSDLEAETDYYVWVRNMCDAEQSSWRAAEMFTTQIACATIQHLDINNVSATGAVLSWRYNAAVGKEATDAELSWKTDAEDVYHRVIVSNPYYILQGLQPATHYNIRLRTICGEDTSSIFTDEFSTKLYGVTIQGDGRNTSDNIPTCSNYKNAYVQMLYPASDMQGVDTIRTIAFNMESFLQLDRVWYIYMGNVARSTLSTTDPVTLDSLTLVADSVTYSAHSGWCTLTLTTPFVYHSDSNLVVAVNDKTNSYRSGLSFYVHSGKSIGNRSDREDLTPSTPGYLSSYSYVADIAFVQPYDPTMCMAPMILASDITSESVQLIWNSGNEGDSWQVEYKLPSDEEWQIAQTSVTDTFFTVTELNPGANYQFRVGTICDEDGNNIVYSESITAFTNCAAIMSPYAEDFSGSSLNPCWVFGNDQGEEEPYLNFEALYMNYSAGGYAILPEFAEDLISLHAIFKIRSSRQDARIVVAVGDNNTDIATFEHIDTFYVTQTNEDLTYECSFANYTGDGHYIAFYSLDKNIYVDDIVIEPQPTCLYPSGLAANNVTANSASISWNAEGGMSVGWMVVYKAQESDIRDTLYVEPDLNSVTLSNLLAVTYYEVTVYNLCTEDTVSSLTPLIFRTECSEVTLPYIENFELVPENTYPICWSSTNAHTYGPYNSKAPIVVSQYNDYVNVLRFCDNVNMISPLIPAPANQLTVSFDAKVDDTDYSGDLAIGIVNSTSDISEAIYVDTIQFNNTDWAHYDISFTSLQEVGQYHVVFNNINNTPESQYGYTDYYSGYLDNVIIMIDYGCGTVSDIVVDNIDATSAHISFTDATAANDYTIGYAAVNDVNNIVDMVNSLQTSATLDGLQPFTVYYTWVRINCNGGSGLWTAGPSFRTTCHPIAELPYHENFDSYSEDVSSTLSAPNRYPNHSMPNCWSFLNLSASEYFYPQAFLCNLVSSSNVYADSANFLCLSSSSDTPIYAVLPRFTTPIDSLQISFTYRNEGVSATNGHLSLGVLTNVNDPASFVQVCEFPQVNVVTAAMHNFKLDVSQQFGDNAAIAFRYGDGTTDKFFLSIDDVVVEMGDDCVIPEAITMTDLEATSATFTWVGMAANYNVQYRTNDSESQWIDAPSVATTTTTLTGLNTHQGYQIRVQSNCGTSLSEWSAPFNFKTPCGDMSLPYSENFDSYSTDISNSSQAPSTYPLHTMPECWDFPILDQPTPRIFLSSREGYVSSGNCLYFVTSASKDAFAVLPRMAADVNQLIMSFTYRNESTSPSCPQLELGVMTDPSNYTTFTLLESYPIQTEVTTAEHNFSLDEELTSGTTYYITFRIGGSGGYYCGVDDVFIDYVPTCTKPGNIVVSNLLANSATISWANNASDFQLQYRLSGASEWQAPIAVASTSTTLNGLTTSTSYQVRVRAICSDEDTSMWSEPVTFKTACGVYELPYSEDFSNAFNMAALDCWNTYQGLLSEVQQGTASLTPNSAWQLGSNQEVNGGGRNAHLNIWGTDVDEWLVSPNINLSVATNLDFDIARYDYNNMFDADDKFVILVSINGGTTWNELHTISGLEFDSIPLYYETAKHFSLNLSQYVGDTVRIAFYGESTVDGADHTLRIDNINIAVPAVICNVPMQLTANNLTETTADLSWQGSASAYEVAYRIVSTEVWTTESVVTNSLLLQNLIAATTYEWRVRSVCGEINSDWAISTFTTAEAIPTCYAPTNITVQPNATSVVIDWTAPAFQQSWEVSLIDTEESVATVVQHPITIGELTPATTYTIKVRAICNEDNYSEWSESISFTTLAIPTCDIPTNLVANNITETSAELSWQGTANVYEVDYRILNAEEWTTEQLSTNILLLQSLTATTTYEWRVRAVCSETNSDWATSTFTTLAEPVCESVTQVTVSDITTSSAKITWQAGSDELEWEVEYGIHNFILGQGENSVVDNTELVLENLTEAAYDVYVRAICGENFYSEWSDTLQFSILASEPEGIGDIDGNFRFNIYPNPTSNAFTISLNGLEGEIEISIVDMNGRMLQIETLECDSDCEKCIDVANLVQGTYFVCIVGNNINSVRKLIVR